MRRRSPQMDYKYTLEINIQVILTNPHQYPRVWHLWGILCEIKKRLRQETQDLLS